MKHVVSKFCQILFFLHGMQQASLVAQRPPTVNPTTPSAAAAPPRTPIVHNFPTSGLRRGDVITVLNLPGDFIVMSVSLSNGPWGSEWVYFEKEGRYVLKNCWVRFSLSKPEHAVFHLFLLLPFSPGLKKEMLKNVAFRYRPPKVRLPIGHIDKEEMARFMSLINYG